MKNEILLSRPNYQIDNSVFQFTEAVRFLNTDPRPELLFITSYPPRECGIATYSQDLIQALNNKFDNSFKITVCPLESDHEQHSYAEPTPYRLNTDQAGSFVQLAKRINDSRAIQLVVIQHEFGFFEGKETDFQYFVAAIKQPLVLVFHTVLPQPSQLLQQRVRALSAAVASIVVMTQASAQILTEDYAISAQQITVIAHGTHLVLHSDKEILKEKYDLSGKKVLSTFGLLSSGKSIETTLNALPAVVANNPEVMFLIIGKTHPSVAKHEGESYRRALEAQVAALGMEQYVRFVNCFLPLSDLLSYLQLTDIYLFTSKDRHQAVSGTFSYAMSCGCAIISTPIPHAREFLKNKAGIIVDFEEPAQLATAILRLLNNEALRKDISLNGLHKMAATAWENAAIAHAMLFEAIGNCPVSLRFNVPPINLNHVKEMTTSFAMIQFAKINQPAIESGYTLDDNARAMVALCQHFELTNDQSDVAYISTYFHFIKHCLQPNGYFLNYVNDQKIFTEQNYSTNLADSNGRAIWALGYLIDTGDLLPAKLIAAADEVMQSALVNIHKIHSTRAMAFIIKGLYHYNLKRESQRNVYIIKKLADRLLQMYRHEASFEWQWYESYLTYGNSILPEAMLCAWLATKEPIYKEVALSSFDFLLSKIFTENSIKVISNKGWLHRGQELQQSTIGGEQPIDVAYTILALSRFYEVFQDEAYHTKREVAFNWFLGNNDLHQIMYNPCTGGCYDGLEENYINLNQGAESTVSYLMARLSLNKANASQSNFARNSAFEISI